MIITKGEKPHTQQPNKRKGKLERKQFVIQLHAISQSNEYMSTKHVMTLQTIH